MPTTASDIIVLYQGGRLPSWHQLSPAQHEDYQQQHVDLMLDIAHRHRLLGLEGFKLLAPQDSYERFWSIAFPDLAGAQAWIEAEMAPPYGTYGYYQYHLALRLPDEPLHRAPPPIAPNPAADPRQVPALEVDGSSHIVLLFERWLPETLSLSPVERGDPQRLEQLQDVSQQYKQIRCETFQLIAPQAAWHRVLIAEFPTQAGVQAWIDVFEQPAHKTLASRTFQLAQKWAPAYFATWLP
ncbi:MAG: hypothetical protein GKR89_17790 [Candidatus Latescibacteria bacterium]|nr:hypothetical protein [Candidatus Latescibacterota bacterium]